jgi:hypothetical protein
LIEHCSQEQVSHLVNELLDHAVALSSHTFGNYVMQHLLEHGGNDAASRLTSILCHQMAFFTGKLLAGNAGDVIGKALSLYKPPAPEKTLSQAALQAQRLANVLLQENLPQDPDRLTTMACSRYGAPALLQALKIADEDRRRACYAFQLHWDTLCCSRYCKHILILAGRHKQQ